MKIKLGKMVKIVEKIRYAQKHERRNVPALLDEFEKISEKLEEEIESEKKRRVVKLTDLAKEEIIKRYEGGC